jgi:PDZ domain
MKYRWTVWAPSVVCCFLLLPYLANGQQDTKPHWQGGSPPASLLQSPVRRDSSQKPMAHSGQSSAADHGQLPSTGVGQPAPTSNQAVAQPDPQNPEESTAQREIPTVWSQPQPPVSMPGYLGVNSRNFYRERFCMHALTIQAVEVAAVAPGSPAERAGLRPARPLTGREVAAATVAGLLTLSPAAPWAAKVLQASGGVDHGDLILAVGGKRVTTQPEFEHALAGYGPQTIVYFTVRRGETIFQLPVRLDDWPAPSSPTAAVQEVNVSQGY